MCFGHSKKVFTDWWLSWSCGIGHDIVWAQEKVSWMHKKVFGDWWLSWPCGIGHHIVWAQMGTRECDQRLVAMYVSFIGLRLTKTSLTLINRTRLRTKGQSAGYPQAQIETTFNSFQRRAP